jgi:hypothetical protein
MGATPCEASNCSRKFGPPTAAQQFSYPQIFSSLAEVRRLADTVRQECDRLDVLINNAGIGSGGDRARSPRARKRAMIAPPVKKNQRSDDWHGHEPDRHDCVGEPQCHNHGGKFRRHKSKWRARARWEDRKYDSNGPALGTACATAVAARWSALTTEEAILRHSVQAKDAKEAFERLSREDKQRLLIFLKSL